MFTELTWEQVQSDDPGMSFRAQVPGGYLVRTVFKTGCGMTFCPDDSVPAPEGAGSGRPSRAPRQLEWEHVKCDDPGLTSRAQVPGGWLVRVLFKTGCGMAFVPDPQYAWKVRLKAID